MTQYGVEEPREAFVESEDDKSNVGQPELLQAVTILREDDLTKPETAETKGELVP